MAPLRCLLEPLPLTQPGSLPLHQPTPMRPAEYPAFLPRPLSASQLVRATRTVPATVPPDVPLATAQINGSATTRSKMKIGSLLNRGSFYELAPYPARRKKQLFNDNPADAGPTAVAASVSISANREVPSDKGLPQPEADGAEARAGTVLALQIPAVEGPETETAVEVETKSNTKRVRYESEDEDLGSGSQMKRTRK